VAILTRLGETDPIVYTPASAGGDEFDNANGYSEVEIYNRAGLTRREGFARGADRNGPAWREAPRSSFPHLAVQQFGAAG